MSGSKPSQTVTRTCGIRTRHYNATAPFVRMVADEERIRIRVVLGLFEYEFKRSELFPIRFHKGWVSQGVVLETKQERIILWLDALQVLEELRGLGYPVEVPESPARRRIDPGL